MGEFLLGVVVSSVFFTIGVFAAGIYGTCELKKEIKRLKEQKKN